MATKEMFVVTTVVGGVPETEVFADFAVMKEWLVTSISDMGEEFARATPELTAVSRLVTMLRDRLTPERLRKSREIGLSCGRCGGDVYIKRVEV
jgi:hypothetical protein